MLTFGAARPFHARVDLPEHRDDVDPVVGSLLEPARRHRVPRVFLLGYAADVDRTRPVVRAAARAFTRAGIHVIDCLCADGRRWYPVPSRPGIPAHGVPYDIGAHPFVTQAVFDGRVLHDSREHLRGSIAADPDLVAGVVGALAALPGSPAQPLAEAAWARKLLQRHVRGGIVPDDRQVARLLHGMLDLRVRDAAWSTLSRATARAHVAFWADVVRRAPDPLVPAAGSLLAFAAWQSGEGALAWCAVERVLEVDGDYSLANLVATILEHAVSPDTWDGECAAP